MKYSLLFLAFLALRPRPAEANSLARACDHLVKKETKLLKNCVSHGEFFEVEPEFVRACAQFHSDIEVRMKCLKSGANLEILNLCKSTGWNLGNMLTCLRSYPTPETLKGCREISKIESEQLKCLRLGREPSQIQSCADMLPDADMRLGCLQKDIPSMEARLCMSKNKDLKNRIECLDHYVAERDRDYDTHQKETKRSLASEPIKQ